MIDKQEELQVIQGARLSGTEAPERLDTDRAAAFVSRVMGDAVGSSKESRKGSSSRRVLLWGSIIVSAAAILALVFWLSGLSGRPETGGGAPALLLENQSIHSASTTLDSLASGTDSLELEIREIIK